MLPACLPVLPAAVTPPLSCWITLPLYRSRILYKARDTQFLPLLLSFKQIHFEQSKHTTIPSNIIINTSDKQLL